MELKQHIEQALKDAMREKNEIRRDAVRLLLNTIKNKEKELRRPLSELETQQVISSQIKQRRDSIEQYKQGGRQDLVEQEEREIHIFQEFLPEPLSTAELEQIISEAIAETDAKSVKELGKVMKVLMPKVGGRADGKRINELARQKLQG